MTADCPARSTSERNIVVHVVVPATGGALGSGRGAATGLTARGGLGTRARRLVVVVHVGHAAAAAPAQHLHAVAANFGGVFLDAFLVGVLAGADRAFDVDLAALFQVLAAHFGGAPEEADSVPFCLLYHLAGLVLVFVGSGDSEVGDGLSARQVAHFGVAPQVADQNNFVDGCHVFPWI